MGEDVFGLVGTTQAGSFRVERVVAEGGFGVVYRAQHGAFRAPVALKCLKVPASMTGPQRETFLEKFREEAELLFRLSAEIPEVVRPLHADVLELDGRFVPFIALEWLDGESLATVISRRAATSERPIGLPKLVKLLRPIALALVRAHHFRGPGGTLSIIHRDLKPDNIFVCKSGGTERVKILDFGIARVKSATTQCAGRVTEGDGLDAFTPAYAAPEQWVPKRFGQAGPWTDVWGLAITMVEALAGRPPIEGDIPSMMGTALDEKRRPTPRGEGVEIPAAVDRVFERALAVDPKNRIKDLEGFWTDLEVAMGLRPSMASRDGRRDSTQPRGLGVPSRTVHGVAPSDAPLLSAGPGHDTVPAPLHRDVGGSAIARDVERGATKPARGQGAASPRAPGPSIPTLMVGACAPKDSHQDAKGVGPAPAAKKPASRAADIDAEEIEPLPELAAPRRWARSESGIELASIHAPRLRPLPRSPAQRLTISDAPSSPLRDRLRTPLRLLFAAVAITVVDLAMTRQTGELLMIGPLRPFWIAGPLALVGGALAFWRLVIHRD